MGFVENLGLVTGTEMIDGEVRLVLPRGAEGGIGLCKYVNSGIGLYRELSREKLDYQMAGEGVSEFLKQGRKFDVRKLNMPANCLDQGPHCHPGGEFAYVNEGEYYDADMAGFPLRTYPRHSFVFYNKGSTHRPLSDEGSEILYMPFDGIVFGKDAEELARKMVKIGTPEEALEYALMWMVPDKNYRQQLMDSLLSDKGP